MTAPQVLVCGEALIDLFQGLDGDAGHGPAPFWAHPSGSPANTAVALARLGTPVQLAARLSRDAFGRLLRRHLEHNGVGLAHAVDADEQSSLAVVGLDDDQNAVYTFYIQDTSDWQWTPGELPARPEPPPTVVHAGSLALALPPGGAVVERFLADQRGRSVVSLDPNVRLPLVCDVARFREDLERWVGYADIVKVGHEDLRALYPGTEPLDVVRGWHGAGRLTVLTQGADGATALFEDDVVHVPGRSVRVVDTVAAGDTFTAGLLDGLVQAGLAPGLADLETADVRAAVARGCAAAAAVCERAGPDPPYRRDLDG